jgi:GrpB-like predicted nucleotidyltransferase (UPF0157 family)
VPGLVAKPVIDIGVLLAPGSEAKDFGQAITSLGYLDRGDQGADGGHVFVLVNGLGERVANLHVVSYGDPQWAAYLRFRDHLRRDDASRAAYAQLKRELARRFPNDRAAYTDGKSQLIKRLLRLESELAGAALSAPDMLPSP